MMSRDHDSRSTFWPGSAKVMSEVQLGVTHNAGGQFIFTYNTFWLPYSCRDPPKEKQLRRVLQRIQGIFCLNMP